MIKVIHICIPCPAKAGATMTETEAPPNKCLQRDVLAFGEAAPEARR